jgi:hypothetical protein
VLVGFTASVMEIDRFIIDCFVQKLTEEQILERSKAVPPRPPRLDEPPARPWEREPKPPILGDCVEPKDQADCMAQLDFVRARLEEHRMILCMAFVHIRDNDLWRDNFHGRPTLEKFCEDLEIDLRTFERYVAEGRNLFFHPEACAAIASGRVTGDRAQFAIAHGRLSESLEPMIDLASRLDVAEMTRADELAEPVGVAYAPAVDMAHEVESILAGEPTENGGELARQLASVIVGESTAIVGRAAALIAQHVGTECPTRTGGIRVGLRDAVYRGWSRPPPFSMFVSPALIDAAEWFAENVKLPEEHGTREMVVHDCYCCQNPRCRKITIRVHSHHIWFQEHGGPDDDWNLIALCPSCHLRGIHSSRMRLVRIGDWLVWTYGDGGVAIVHSPVGGSE